MATYGTHAWSQLDPGLYRPAQAGCRIYTHQHTVTHIASSNVVPQVLSRSKMLLGLKNHEVPPASKFTQNLESRLEIVIEGEGREMLAFTYSTHFKRREASIKHFNGCHSGSSSYYLLPKWNGCEIRTLMMSSVQTFLQTTEIWNFRHKLHNILDLTV